MQYLPPFRPYISKAPQPHPTKPTRFSPGPEVYMQSPSLLRMQKEQVTKRSPLLLLSAVGEASTLPSSANLPQPPSASVSENEAYSLSFLAASCPEDAFDILFAPPDIPLRLLPSSLHSAMSSLVDQTHGPSSSFPVESHMPLIKNIPRLQCAIPDAPSRTGHSQSSFETSIAPPIINMDSIPMDILSVDGRQSSIDHITCLERSVCSNFYCCGTQHPDLHALLAHFEGNHIVELTPNGKRVYPVALCPSSGESTPASSRSSSVAPSVPSSPISPPYSIPSSPSDMPLAIPSPNQKLGLSVLPVYTPFTPCWPVDPAYSIPDNSEIIVVQETNFDFSTQPSLLPPLQLEAPESPASQDSELGDDDTLLDADFEEGPSSPLPDCGLRPIAHTPKAVRPLAKGKRSDGHSEILSKQSTTSKPSKSRRGVSSSNSHSRRREKMFRCPKQGCVKAYLNPNGLKYHLEKGTCKMEDDDKRPATEQLQEASHSLLSPSLPESSLVYNASQSAISRQSPQLGCVDQLLPSFDKPQLVHDESDTSESIGTLSQVTPRPCVSSMPASSNLSPPDVVAQRDSSQLPPRPPQASFKASQPRLQSLGPQLRLDHHVQTQQPTLATDPHTRRISSQGSAGSHTQAHQSPYHYPVPSYPHGYNLPQHRSSYHDSAVYHSLHAPIMVASSASSQ